MCISKMSFSVHLNCKSFTLEFTMWHGFSHLPERSTTLWSWLSTSVAGRWSPESACVSTQVSWPFGLLSLRWGLGGGGGGGSSDSRVGVELSCTYWFCCNVTWQKKKRQSKFKPLLSNTISTNYLNNASIDKLRRSRNIYHIEYG